MRNQGIFCIFNQSEVVTKHVLFEQNTVKQNYTFENWYPKLFTGDKT